MLAPSNFVLPLAVPWPTPTAGMGLCDPSFIGPTFDCQQKHEDHVAKLLQQLKQIPCGSLTVVQSNRHLGKRCVDPMSLKKIFPPLSLSGGVWCLFWRWPRFPWRLRPLFLSENGVRGSRQRGTRAVATVIPCTDAPTARQRRLGWLDGAPAVATHWLAFPLAGTVADAALTGGGGPAGSVPPVLPVRACRTPFRQQAPPGPSSRRVPTVPVPLPSAPGRESHSLTPVPVSVVVQPQAP